MPALWRDQALAVEILCNSYDVTSDLVRAHIFSFVSMFPRVVACGSLDGSCILFRTSPRDDRLLCGDPIRLAHPGPASVHSVVIARLHDVGRVIATGCSDGVVRLFSDNGNLLSAFEAYRGGPVYSVQLEELAGQRILYCATATGGPAAMDTDTLASTDYAHIWRLTGARGDINAERIALCHHRFGVNGVAMDANRQLVATASDDRTAALFNFAGHRIATCQEHASFVWEVALSADLGLIATACEDHHARLFDLKGTCMARLCCGAGCCEIALDQETRTVIASSADGSLRVWSLDAEHDCLGIAHHDAEVHSAALAVGFGRLVSGTLEGDLVEWQMPDGGVTPLQLATRRQFNAAAVTLAIG